MSVNISGTFYDYFKYISHIQAPVTWGVGGGSFTAGVLTWRFWFKAIAFSYQNTHLHDSLYDNLFLINFVKRLNLSMLHLVFSISISFLNVLKRLLTGGHWASLSAATSCTFRCLLWDFPLDLTSLCKT